MSTLARLSILVSTSLLAACVTSVPLGEPGLREQDVLAQAADLRTTPTTRDEVHAAFGLPILADGRSGAEVFRVTGRQRQMALFFVPYPIPMPMPSQKHEGYTLVTYDEAGHVTGVDVGYSTAADFGPTQNVVLRSGDYEFLHAKHDRLLVTPERYLRDRSPPTDASACTLLVGCTQSCAQTSPGGAGCDVCWTRLQVDDGPVRELPLVDWIMWPLGAAGEATRPTRESSCRDMGGSVLYDGCSLWRRPIVPLRLAPGPHTLRASSPTLRGEVAGEFECEPGGFVFATLAGEVTERYSLSRQVKERFNTGAASGSISISRDPPPGPPGPRVIVNP